MCANIVIVHDDKCVQCIHADVDFFIHRNTYMSFMVIKGRDIIWSVHMTSQG